MKIVQVLLVPETPQLESPNEALQCRAAWELEETPVLCSICMLSQFPTNAIRYPIQTNNAMGK